MPIRRLVDQRLPALARLIRKRRDERLFKRDMQACATYEYNSHTYSVNPSLLGQFGSRDANGELEAMNSLLKTGFDVFVDIGANHGLFSLLASSHSSCKTIIAVEPCFRNYQVLLRNIKKAAIRKEVIALHAAMGDLCEQRDLMGGLEGGSFVSGWGGVGSTYSERVQLLRIDQLKSLWKENSKVLVKIDAEGFEPQILRGAEELIKSQTASLVVELSLTENHSAPDGRAYSKVFDFIFENGMKAFTFPGCQPISTDLVSLWVSGLAAQCQASHGRGNIPKRTLNILFRPGSS